MHILAGTFSWVEKVHVAVNMVESAMRACVILIVDFDDVNMTTGGGGN